MYEIMATGKWATENWAVGKFGSSNMDPKGSTMN